MTDQEGSVLNLRPIFNKLGHQLEEIRVRSLKNLLSKLEHQLVCDADLVQEKHLHIRLLEWFNFSSCPLQQQVLALVLRFTKHPSAAQIYLDIGGVDFLTQLRTNLDPARHRLVDAILDNLYHLPAAEQELERVECLYQQHKHVSVPPAGSSQPLPSQFLQTSLVSDITENNTTDAHFTSMGRQLSPETQDVGYFGQPRGEETRGPQAQGYGAGAAIVTASCFKFSTFPWVPLTPTDRHVLSSTDSSLKSKDVSLVVSACEFLSDVVFQDFPAEVFLQRPVIVKSLLSLLSLPASGAPDTYEVSQQAVQTLRDLTAALQARIYFYQDPALYTPKHDFNLASSAGSTASYMSQSLESSVSADSRPSVIGYSDMRHRGDGQDGDNSSQNTHGSATPEPLGSPIEQTDISEIQSLQFLQWSIPQFCLCVLERLLPCLKTPHEAFILHGLQLGHQVAALLGESVTRAALWHDESLPARELKEKIHDVLEMLGDVMYLHHHGNLSPATPPEDLRQHRVAYLGLGVFWVRVVETLVPADKVLAALPDCCTQILTLLCEDEALALSLPDVRTFTADLLAVVRPERHALYTLAQSTAHSFRSTCAYLMDSTDMTDDTVLDLLSLSEDAIRSLAYHQNLQLVEGCVQQASYICKKTSPNPTAVKQSQGILLTLLAYPIPPVRLQAYNSILTIVKDALGVEHVIEPTSNLSASIAFLFDRRLLYQILCFGCTDAQAEVQIVAEEVLLYLLQSQLLIPAARWQQLLEALGGVLPILQGLGEPDSNLSKSVLGLLSTDPQIETGNLPTFEKFRATLRLMYSDHPRLRMEGLGRLAWFLANEQDSMRKLPLFSELDVANLTNVFVVDPPRSLVDDDLDRSVFTPDSMQKVYEIFVSENVEATVRHSAGEQLAIILQDPHLHEAFHKLGAIKKMVSLLKHGVKKPEKNTVNPYSTVLPCILKILRSLVQHNSSLRHKWAHDSKLYYPILRAGLLHHRDSSARKELSELLAFLLFDEVAQVKIWEDATPDLPMTFSLPLLITKRYSLPVKCPTHHLTSPHTVLLPPDPDPLRSGGLAEMLRVAWGVAWCDGVQGLIDDSRREEGESNKMYHRSLALTPVDRAVLSTSYLPHALRSCIHAVDNATGHGDVTRAVLRLCSYLVVTISQDVSEVMDGLTWRDALSRFTRVIPSSTADESLLSQLLQFLLLAVHTPAPPPGFSPWVVGLLSDPKGALLWLLGQGDTAPEELPQGQVKIKRQLNRHLLKFVQTFIGKYPYSLVDKSTFECVRGDLTQNLLTRINRHDTTHFYNLASLESTLLCLLQVTARPGWSVGSPDHTSLALSLQTLQNLSEVISAFHVGRGGVSMSYMGRGVTRSATVCLRHLAHEMATQLQSKDWPRNWLFSRQATADTVGESGLHWLIPLWSYRDTEVRSAGVGIAAALTSTEAGRITMATQCQHIPGGIWGTAFSLLLDHSECSIVRQQACLLLTNLTSQPMPSGSVETAASVWQGPIVRNEETQVSLVGLSALVALLHHSQFYQEMMVLLANTYLQPAIHPVSVASGSRVSSGVTTGSQATITTTGSMTPAGTQMTDLTASSGQLMTSTPVDVSTHSPQVALSSRLTPQPPGAALSHRTDTGATTPASVIGDQTGTTLTSDLSDGREYHSVVAPCLVSAVCGLLGNLVALAPDDTLASITKENMHTALLQVLDVGLLEAYRTELCDTPYRAQFLLAYRDLLRVHTDVLELVRRCGTHDAGVRRDVLQNTAATRQIVRTLGVSYQGDADTEQTCAALWQAAYTLLASLIHAEGQGALAALTPVIVKHWGTVAGRTVSILQAPALSESPLWVSALTTLSLLLCEEARLLRAQGGHRQADTYYVLDRLDNSGEPDGKDLFTMTSGALLCQALIRAYDAVTLRPLDQTYTVKMAVINALKSLLVISTTAKVTALEAGLVETITEHLKHLVHKLSLDALELRAGDRGARRRDSPALAEVRLTADLLRNAMYANTDVKLAAYECGLAGIVHNLWVWCLMDHALMDSTLALLATFTARCTQACSSLAFTSPSQTVDKTSALRTTITNNSLVHALIKYLQRESGGAQAPGTLLKAGYGLLANLTLSQECRGILWKSNFLHEFASMSPQKHKKQKKARVLESLWLDLLVNLSFSTEGQNMVLKVDDAVSLLLEFGTDSSDHNQSRATLVLRNLCFHAPNKPKLLANDDLVPFFLRSIESSPGDVKKVACSALLALAYNNQKAKGVLKNAHIQCKLQTSYTNMVNVGGPPGGGGQGAPPWAQSCINDLKGLLVLLRA